MDIDPRRLVTLLLVYAPLSSSPPSRNEPRVDISKCSFPNLRSITGKGATRSLWKIVNGYIDGVPMEDIGPHSPDGPLIEASLVDGAEPSD